MNIADLRWLQLTEHRIAQKGKTRIIKIRLCVIRVYYMLCLSVRFNTWRKVHIKHVVSLGCAMFAMLFGAGNVIFPLVLGRDVGDKLAFGLLGFIMTAMIVPLLGLIATMLFDGEYKRFFGRLGVLPGKILIIFCMILIGPFALIPRCITISHAAIKVYVPQFTILYFSLVCAVIIFLCTLQKNRVIDLIGTYIGPIKLFLLFIIIVNGLLSPSSLVSSGLSASQGFMLGFNTGYRTADLLCTIFFSGLIFAGVKRALMCGSDRQVSLTEIVRAGLKAGVFGAFLLAIAYFGFFLVAAFNAQALAGVADVDIFSATAQIVLGSFGGLFANITVAVSCLTTAIALTTVFADFLQKEIFLKTMPYRYTQIITIGVAACMSNLGFGGIMKIVGPVLGFIYPSLIVLSLVNVAYKLCGFRYVWLPVGASFIVTILFHYFC